MTLTSLQNRDQGLDMTFNTDRSRIQTRYRAGTASLIIDGSITNLTRALTSRSATALRITYARQRRTLFDVTKLRGAVFAGAHSLRKSVRDCQAPISTAKRRTFSGSIATEYRSFRKAAGAYPDNIEASVRLAGRNVLYAIDIP